MFALHTSVKYWYEKYGCVVPFPLPGPGLSEARPELEVHDAAAAVLDAADDAKVLVGGDGVSLRRGERDGDPGRPGRLVLPFVPLVGSCVREVPVEVHGLAPDGDGVDVLEVADQREGLRFAIIGPWAIRCAVPRRSGT